MCRKLKTVDRFESKRAADRQDQQHEMSVSTRQNYAIAIRTVLLNIVQLNYVIDYNYDQVYNFLSVGLLLFLNRHFRFSINTRQCSCKTA